MYQTCTEFGFYQTSDSEKQPFGDLFPLKYVHDSSTVFTEKKQRHTSYQDRILVCLKEIPLNAPKCPGFKIMTAS